MKNNKSIEFKNVTKTFRRKKVLNNINFSVKKGSFHALIGENGAGKTTIIRTMLGLYQQYVGKIEFDGVDAINPKTLKNISYINENPVFPTYFSTFEYLYWTASLNGTRSKKEIKAEIERLLEKFKITYLRNRDPNKFSSGEKKKILLIQIMIQDSNIIILDEPAANLDPTARKILFDTIDELHKKGKTILISSHILSEIGKYVTEATIVSGGKIMFSGNVEGRDLTEVFEENAFKNFRGDKHE